MDDTTQGRNKKIAEELGFKPLKEVKKDEEQR